MRRLVPLVFTVLLVAVAVPAFAGDECKSAHGSCAAGECKTARTALKGYCPVSYLAMGKAMKGNSKFASTLNGKRYVFASAGAKKMFDADPAKYAVAYDGLCATALSMGKQVPGDPKLFSVHAGHAYLFSSADAKQAFDAMADGIVAKADAQWASKSNQ